MNLKRTRTIAIVAALLLATSVIVPALGAAADSSLSLDVEQQSDTGEALVTVTHNGSAVDNGTLLVNASGNYSANESSALDSNGTVTLPAPNETVDVELTAEYENTTVTETVTLVPLSDSLSVTVEENEDGSATAWVTQYDDPVENATVTVEVGENESYNGTGEYETDQNGTVSLPAPDTSVAIFVTAEYANLTATDELTLSGTELTVAVSQDAEGAVTITVMDGGEYVDGATVTVESENYTYTGSYTAENGTVSLPAPTQNVSVTITATDDNETASTTAELIVEADENPNNDFAENLGQFINFLKTSGVDGPLGQEVSEFVHANNPATADDERGPPAHSNGADEMENDTADDDRHGPPEHANANGHTDVTEDQDRVADENQTDADTSDAEESELSGESVDDETEVNENEEAEEVDDDEKDRESPKDNRRGPPEHANGR